MRTSPHLVVVLFATVFAAVTLGGCGTATAGGPAGSAPDDAVSSDHRSVGADVASSAVASVEGTVTDSGGRPVPTVMMTASSLASPPLPVPELAVVTDAAGRYAWFGLAPGRYVVSSGRGATSASSEVTVVSGRATTVDLVLR